MFVLLEEQLCSPVVDSRATLVGPEKESRSTNLHPRRPPKKIKQSFQQVSQVAFISMCASPVNPHIINSENKLCWSSADTHTHAHTINLSRLVQLLPTMFFATFPFHSNPPQKKTKKTHTSTLARFYQIPLGSHMKRRLSLLTVKAFLRFKMESF